MQFCNDWITVQNLIIFSFLVLIGTCMKQTMLQYFVDLLHLKHQCSQVYRFLNVMSASCNLRFFVNASWQWPVFYNARLDYRLMSNLSCLWPLVISRANRPVPVVSKTSFSKMHHSLFFVGYISISLVRYICTFNSINPLFRHELVSSQGLHNDPIPGLCEEEYAAHF